jgi:hypothetical protein
MQTREALEPVEEVPAEVLVLFQTEDEPAPRGRLGRVDWILLGAVSRLRARGKFSGERGATALLSPDRKLKADRVLVMGIGRRADFSKTAFYRLSYQAAQILLDLGCAKIALDLPYRLFSQESPEKIRRDFLEGFTAELQRARPDIDFSLATLAPPDRV